ncbi:hypothetical protein FG386_001766 [Cryptosporidium ryanae]|uniref:uncharacterized protein n=1 Tax=Cryptosporidium ryanae TaxID=515981 RepID=UPI003519E664|nr:hypothetical protein FG386_001766 [Cryptosporidium ryanae]
MPGVYEKQCRGPRFDYMVSIVEKCRDEKNRKNYASSYKIISELLFSICNDYELIEEFFYSGAFQCCCELLSIKGISEMNSGADNVLNDQEMEIPRLIIEQFSLISTFTIQSFDEEIGEISLLVYFLTERHRYYVDVNWKSHELEYISTFLQSHFKFLYCAINSFNKYQSNEGPSLLLMTLKNIEVVIRSCPGHRVVPNMIKVLADSSTWGIMTLLSEMITSNIVDIVSEKKDDSSSQITQFRECAIVLIQIIAHIPIIGVNKGLNKYLIPSLTQIGLQKLLLSQNNGDVYIRCSCKYCENCRKIQKICTKKDELIIQETIPLFQTLFESFMKNEALNIIINLISSLQKTEDYSTLNEDIIDKIFGYKKTYLIMLQHIIKTLDSDNFSKVMISLMKIFPKYTKFKCESSVIENYSESMNRSFIKLRISKQVYNEEASLSKIDHVSEEIFEIISLSDNAKLIASCITSIILHKFDFPINYNSNLSQILEIICPTFELIIKKLIVEWEKKSELLRSIVFSFEQIITILSETKTFLILLVPIYIRYLFNKKSVNEIKSKNSFNFIRKGISDVLNLFTDLFQTCCQMTITQSIKSESEVKISKVSSFIDMDKKDTIYSIGSSLISCLAIISDVSTYNWTCVSRRRYIPSPHFEICGWIASNQYKFMDHWKNIFLLDRCICIKELSQIITLISERSSGLNSRKNITENNLYFSKEFLDQCETYFEETDEEINIESDEIENIINKID